MGINLTTGQRKYLNTDSTLAAFVLANQFYAAPSVTSGELLISGNAALKIIPTNNFRGGRFTFLGNANNATGTYQLWGVSGIYSRAKQFPDATDPFNDLDGIEVWNMGVGGFTCGNVAAAGTEVGSAYFAADTVTFTRSTNATSVTGPMTQMQSAYLLGADQAYSPTNDTPGKLIIPDFGDGIIGVVCELKLGTATGVNMLFELTGRR